MKIALLNTVNKSKKGAMNKDLAGGLGTFSDFGCSLTSKFLTFIKKKNIKLPIISFAYLQAIFKNKGYEVEYLENNSIDKKYDLVLIYGSVVDFKNETRIAEQIKNKYPRTKVGFFGPFPTIKPEIFNLVDFVIKGEVESFFLYEFKNLKNLNKIINVKKLLDLEDLPSPNFDNFPISSYSYFPAIKEKPFLTLQASKGCPYSCSYYCPYGSIQGPKYRIRSAGKLVQDIQFLIKNYNVKGIQFRDPTFGLNKGQIEKFCDLMTKKKINIKWGIETRLDILDKKILDLMFKAGLRNLNVGIETVDEEIAKKNKRQLIKIGHQEEIINYCKKIGIKISAFYIFGLMGDTEKSIFETINYAKKLNTNTSQFTISCPYPGTKYHDELKSKNLILEDDFEKFNSVNIVFKHDNLSNKQIKKMQEFAFKKYYFRLNYLKEFLKWRIREFWL